MSVPQETTTPLLMPPPQSQSQSQSQSRSHSRPRRSHDMSANDMPYLPHGPDGLLLPEDTVTEEDIELLHEFIHPHHRNKRRAETDDTLVADAVVDQIQEANEAGSLSDADDEDDEDFDALKKRPWYRRPSPIWLLCMAPISSTAMSSCAAPRIEIYTLLACREHKPEYNAGDLRLHYTSDPRMNINNAVLPLAPSESMSWNAAPFNNSHYLAVGLDTILPLEDALGSLEETKDTSKCASDPVVQAAAAKIIAVLTTTMGILSCLTTAFWGSLSDRYGRLRVLSISVIGLLFNDAIFIMVFFFSRQLPGGYWFLLLGPIVEGVFGGTTSMVAAIHAYIADVAAPGDRSRQFSLGMGLLFVGMAFGPTIGSVLVRWTRTPISVFYMATAVHVVLAVYVWTVVPESLPKQIQRANRRRTVRRRVEETRAEEREASDQGEGQRRIRVVRLLGRTKRVFSFLSPLSVFAPVEIENSTPGVCFGKKRRDWSLTFIGASCGFSAFVLASYQYIFQYAAATFGWSSEELGYWLSLVGASRALYLTLVLPVIIKIFNRPKQPVQLPIEPSEPLIHDAVPDPTAAVVPAEPSSSTLVDTSPSSSSVRMQTSSRSAPTSTHALAPHSSTFDLRLARWSLIWETICYALIPLAPTAAVFSVFGCLAAWGGGFGPAVQALALEMYVRRNIMRSTGEGRLNRREGSGKGMKKGGMETGRLFGAISVVQSMCSQIFGPTLFGLVFMNTVEYFPTAIFWLSTFCIGTSMVFLLLVRLPQGASHGHLSAEEARDADLESTPSASLVRDVTLVDVSDEVEGNHLGKRNSKGQEIAV